jgi:hypothetical protein
MRGREMGEKVRLMRLKLKLKRGKGRRLKGDV